MSILLLGADYYGTLAAARSLGRAGVTVHVADDHRGGRTLFSRFARGRHQHPPIREVPAFLAWLRDFGSAHPGTALPATNDHLAWLFSRHQSELGASFAMYQADESAILALLDKGRLTAVCKELGIATPKTEVIDAPSSFLPPLRSGQASRETAEQAGDRVGFPLLIKPRTQIFLESGLKGVIVEKRADLDAELARYRSLAKFSDVFASAHPEALEPMLQEYIPDAETSIFSVSGFVDRNGRMVCRAAMKVLQRPRKVGIGLCFEARAAEPQLEKDLVALAKQVGYFGPFEAEFIVRGDERLLIDYNPRFFSQMAFDDARGMATARLTYHAALGEQGEVDALVERANREGERGAGARVYQHGGMLRLVLALQSRSGEMSKSESDKWHAWMRENAGASQDAVWSGDDMLPAVVDGAMWLKHFARHPRSFWRSFVQNR